MRTLTASILDRRSALYRKVHNIWPVEPIHRAAKQNLERGSWLSQVRLMTWGKSIGWTVYEKLQVPHPSPWHGWSTVPSSGPVAYCSVLRQMFPEHNSHPARTSTRTVTRHPSHIFQRLGATGDGTLSPSILNRSPCIFPNPAPGSTGCSVSDRDSSNGRPHPEQNRPH